MGSIGRSIRRKKEKANRKQSQKEMNNKLNLTSLLPEECLSCEKPFDKSDKKMIDEWYMIVRNDPQSVNLYCPACWVQAQETLREIDFK